MAAAVTALLFSLILLVVISLMISDKYAAKRTEFLWSCGPIPVKDPEWGVRHKRMWAGTDIEYNFCDMIFPEGCDLFILV